MLFALLLLSTSSLLLAAGAQSGAAPKIPFAMPEIKPPRFADRTFDIRDYGAASGGKTLCTEAFAAAIDACSESGGGRVLVPSGDWLTGPIHLKSSVELHLQKGAQVLFSTDYKDYLPPVFTRWEGMECRNWSPLIYANGCSNIAVTGEGTLNGQGEAWWPLNAGKKPAARRLYKMILDGVPAQDRVFASERWPLRPSFIQPINCTNVLIEGVTLIDGPMWTVHPVYCENTIVRGVTVRTHGPNTDGIVPDSCRNIIIENCFFSTGDDCVVIKSGLNEEGWRVNRPCENVVVRYCRTERGHGGVVIGSEMSGGVRNVFVHDCDFQGTQRGIRLKSKRGRGGVVENIWVDRVSMGRIRDEAIIINAFYGAGTVEPDTQEPPAFRNINIRRIICEEAERAAALTGLPEKPLEDVRLEDIKIKAEKGVYSSDVRGLTLRDVRVEVEGGPAVHLVNTRDALISGSECAQGTDVFLKVEGENSSDIRLEDNDLSGVRQAVVLDGDVSSAAVERD